MDSGKSIHCLPLSYLLIIVINQLKGIYTAIEDFRSNVSGAHWDAVTGATIEGPTAEKVWNDIVKARVRYKQFPFNHAISFTVLL